MHTTPTWNIFQKIGFRFFFIYVLFNIFPFPIVDSIPYLEDFTKFLTESLWEPIIPFVSDTFFGLEVSGVRTPTGSGDMSYDFMHLFSCALFAITGTIIWSIIDRKRKNYSTLLRFLLIYITYYLIHSMLTYGFIKAFPMQFSAPSLGRLIQPYGHSSPMGIAWTFMGASKAYTIFSGLAELVGGFLLIFRRTRTLGGLVSFAVMLNVFMMNMCYDIPVKLYSFHLLFFAFFIFIQDWKRLFAVFFTKTAVVPRSFPRYFKEDKFHYASIALKVIILGHFFYGTLGYSMEQYKTRGPNRPKPAMYGIYEIEHFQKNNDTIPMLVTNDTLWRRIVFQYPNYFNAYRMNNTARWLSLEIDTIAKTMLVKNRRDSTDIYNLKYTLKDSMLTLSGTHKNDTLFIKARQYDLRKFKLINRGFNWINEYPYNR